MKELFMLIRESLLKKEPLVLVAIIGSSGSTPRETGSLMLVGQGDGGATERLWGSIGGGKSEYLAIGETASLLQRRDSSLVNSSFTRQYILHSNEAAEIGAVCGGEVSVFFRLLDADEPGLLDVIEKGIACFGESKAAWFLMEVSDGVAYNALGFAGEEGLLACAGTGPQNLKALLKSGAVYLEENRKFWLSVPIVSEGLVYIFGGGHIAQELVPLLSRLGFRCVVFDDREEFLRKELFPTAEKLVLGEFGHIEKSLTLTERDYAVIITRGHIWDLEAWAFALNSPAAYIGVIGSMAKHKFVKAKLLERGFASSAIDAPRVHVPIGIKIKSKTPAEISVSIAGELILTRAR
ncbi:MAG: XdhC family protein [Treponema sp.]|jgi:xanthine dehydrogenase accessory factor|nr:XdhC family protein [Treponema sp.]